MSLDASGEGLGIERQTGLGRRLAEAREWQVGVDPALTSDNSLSASGSVERPGFERLLGLIESGRIKAVAAYSFDRIARNQRDGVRFLELAKTKGVQVAFCQGGDLDLTTAMGQFVAEMMLSIAKLEIGIKGERQRAANKQRAERGIPWKTAGRAFGWIDHDTHHPAEAPELAEAYQRVLAGGTLRGIATGWNSQGLLGKQGKGWTSAKIRSVLLNPRNCGRMVQAGVDYGQRFDPIIDPDVFDAVNTILTDPARGKGPGPRRLLSGIARCPCGAPVLAAPSSKGRRAYRHHPDSGEQDGRGHVCRAAEPIEGYVTKLVLERLSRPDAVDLLRAEDEETGSLDLAGLRQRKAALLAKAEQAAVLWATEDGEMSNRQMQAVTKTIEHELDGIDRALKTACSTSVLTPLVDADAPADVWDGMDLDERRAVIKDLFSSIVVGSPGRGRPKVDKATGWPVDLPTTIRVQWRQPTTQPDNQPRDAADRAA